MKHIRCISFVCLLLILGLTGWVPDRTMAAPTTTFDVNNASDAVDANPGDGVCETALGNGVCTLRAAIQEANADTGSSHQINLDEETYLLTIPTDASDTDAKGDLDILSTITISGVSMDTTIVDGNQLDRVFHVQSSGSATFQNITIRNGSVPTGNYGGGGILNQYSTVTIQNCKIENNQSVNLGGGIDNAGTMTIRNSTIQFNAADKGGGILSDGGPLDKITIEKSLIYSNTATTLGGGINNNDIAELKNVTISSNSTDGIFNAGNMEINYTTIAENAIGVDNSSVFKLNHTVLADNQTNCQGASPFTSLGYNLDSGASCGLTEASDYSSADARLESLADNGGVTLTYALLFGSPAIDGGSVTCISNDQRSVSRPIDGDGDGSAVCDIGAYESERLYGIYLPLVLR